MEHSMNVVTVTAEDGDATVVSIFIDDHLVAECIVRPPASYMVEAKADLLFRGVREQYQTDLGFWKDVFPVSVRGTGDRRIGGDNADA